MNNYTVRRIPLDENEDRALRLAAEKAFRRPEQQARWLLRQVLGLSADQQLPTEHAKSSTDPICQDLVNAAL
jgi:hypothetical protein